MGGDEQEQEAAYGCPACDSRLYGWSAAKHPVDGARLVLDHCESCGLVVTRAPGPPDAAAELTHLERDGEVLVAPNRESFQGGIGGAQWAGMEPDRRRLHLNPRAAKLLLRRQGVELVEHSTPFSGRSYRLMLLTMINAFTLKDNFLCNARAGRLPRSSTREKLAYALDAVVSCLVAIPLAIVAVPTELIGSALGRGGVMRLRTARTAASAD
jgi:hypothetical protein